MIAGMVRPRVLEPHDLISIEAARDRGLLFKQLAYRMGVSVRTLYRAVGEQRTREGAPASSAPAGAQQDQAALPGAAVVSFSSTGPSDPRQSVAIEISRDAEPSGT